MSSSMPSPSSPSSSLPSSAEAAQHQPISTTTAPQMDSANTTSDAAATSASTAAPSQPTEAAPTTNGHRHSAAIQPLEICIETAAATPSADAPKTPTPPATCPESVSVVAAKSTSKAPKAAASRLLRRAFSMPRNPFRMSGRKLLKGNGHNQSSMNGDANSALPEESGGSDGSDYVAGLDTETLATAGSYTRTDEAAAAPTNGGHENGTEAVAAAQDDGGQGDANDGKRRSQSWRKVIMRLAQQVTTNIRSKHAHSLPFAASAQRVPPLDAWPADQIPGVTGLKNHGNTCFMNAVLQCLSHTDILAEYFVLDLYKADLKRRNKMTSKKFGTKGELTEQLALVLKALWTCKFESDWSTTVGFKAVVDRYGTQFRSAQQHDAQEFLFWLLDKVHEDLNSASKRKYKTMKNTFGRPDEILAAETLANHVRGNRSFVQAVFQAQFRSSLACPQCHRQSNTFDPFHCISVQLPQQHVQVPVYVTVRYAQQHPRQVRMAISIAAGSPVSALRAQLHSQTQIAAGHMVLVEMSDTGGFGRVLADSYTLDVADDAADIRVYCMEMPADGDGGGGGDAADRDARKCDGLLTVLVANARRDEAAPAGVVRRFGTPFCVEIRRDVTYTELQKRLLKEMQQVLRPDVFAYAVAPVDMFRMRLQDPSADSDAYMEPRVECPLFMEMIDLALVVLAADAGPAHVKLLLEWTEPERYFADQSDETVDDESVRLVQEKLAKSEASGGGSGGRGGLSLEECLEHYTRAETLAAEDAWRCPHCQQYLPVVKQLGLWSLPEILVVHLKRFSAAHPVPQVGGRSAAAAPVNNGHNSSSEIGGGAAAKLTTAVTFPLFGFDMTPHLAKQNQRSTAQAPANGRRRKSSSSSSGGGSSSSSSSGGGDNSSPDVANLYDLYAVCYHAGETLETGHYTAACKNPYDQRWYRFDDQKVTAVAGGSRTAAEIVTNDAYILFYQRRILAGNIGERTSDTSTAGNGSLSTGLSSLGLSEHWVSKIAAVPLPAMPTSISQGSIALSFAASTVELPVVVTADYIRTVTTTTTTTDPIVVDSTDAGEQKIVVVGGGGVAEGSEQVGLESAAEPPAEATAVAMQHTSEDIIMETSVLRPEVVKATAAAPIESPIVVSSVAAVVGAEASHFVAGPEAAQTSPEQEPPAQSPPTTPTQQARLKSPTISRGSLSFSEVFKRREPPLLYINATGSSGGVNNMCGNRYSGGGGGGGAYRAHSFLSEDVTVAQLRSRAGGGGIGSGGDASGSGSYLLVDNRSASWVS